MKKILMGLTILLTILLAACSKNEITAKAVIILDSDKTTLTALYFDVEIVDAKNQITGKKEARLYYKDGKLVPNKVLSIEENSFSSSFTGLTEATEYTLHIYATIGRRMISIGSIEAKTRSSEIIEIETVEQFLNMTMDYRADYELMNSLDFTGVEFKTIFNLSSQPFQGTFNGNNHTLSNIKFSSITSATSVFGFVSTGKIKDLNIENFQVGTAEEPLSTQTQSRVAVVASRVSASDGLISNVHIKDSEIHYISSSSLTTTFAVQIGMIAGEISGTVEDVTVENGVISFESKRQGRTLIGGAIGKLSDQGTIKRVSVDVDITFKLNSTATARENYTALIGGIVGDSASGRIRGIEDVVQIGNIDIAELNYNTREGTSERTYSLFVGGIAGQSITQIKNAIFAGNIDFNHEESEHDDEKIIKKFYIGGLVGFYNSNRTIEGALRFGSDKTIIINDDSVNSSYSQTIARKTGTISHQVAVYVEEHLLFNGDSKVDDDLVDVIDDIDLFFTSDWIKEEFDKIKN